MASFIIRRNPQQNQKQEEPLSLRGPSCFGFGL